MKFTLSIEDRDINLRASERTGLVAHSMIINSITDGRHAVEYLTLLGNVGSSFHQNRLALEEAANNLGVKS